MDTPLHPPVRIHTRTSIPVSTRSAEKRIAAFIADFQARSTASQGSNTAVTVQLQKLRDALHSERKKKHEEFEAILINIKTHGDRVE